MAKATQRYLSRHAEPEAALAEHVEPHRHVVTVAACGEDPSFIEGLWPALVQRDALLIVVVNGAVRHSEEVHRANHLALETLARFADCRAIGQPSGCLLGRRDGVSLLLIDRASPDRRLPPRQGVGMARRIACDIALSMHATGKLSQRQVHLTDADVQLPSDYLETAEEPAAVALSYPFWHRTEAGGPLERAHAEYEIYLRYYRLGLKWAGSGYAHHTIGSTLAIDAASYAVIGGMPRKQAGEDFYLLNKAAKLGPVVVPKSQPIIIAARRSGRVPFGTGPATAQIFEANERGEDYRVEHPHVFVLLRSWLRAVANSLMAPERACKLAVERAPTELQSVLQRALDALDLGQGLAKALRGAPPSGRAKRAAQYFDAFRTMKLVHAIRDAGISDAPWRHALEIAPFLTDFPRSLDAFESQAAMALIDAEG